MSPVVKHKLTYHYKIWGYSSNKSSNLVEVLKVILKQYSVPAFLQNAFNVTLGKIYRITLFKFDEIRPND